MSSLVYYSASFIVTWVFLGSSALFSLSLKNCGKISITLFLFILITCNCAVQWQYIHWYCCAAGTSRTFLILQNCSSPFIFNEGLPLLTQISWLPFGFTAWLASSAVDAGVARPSSHFGMAFLGSHQQDLERLVETWHGKGQRVFSC